MKKVHAPGRSSRVKLYLNVGQEQNQIKTYLAKVDLGQLGSHVRWQRFCGNIDSIYVKGKEGSRIWMLNLETCCGCHAAEMAC